jgi:hypothetical protein
LKHQIVYLQDNIYYNTEIKEQKNDYFFGPLLSYEIDKCWIEDLRS